MQPVITSTQNPRIKLAASLDKPRVRRELGLFLVEGLPELKLAIKAGYEVTGVFFKTDSSVLSELEILVDQTALIPVSDSVFSKLAYREGTSEVIATVKTRQHPLVNLILPINPLILVLESVEKPGNLGAILRTADAAGIDAVVVCDPQTDFYNPNVIRSSIGAVFTNQLAVSDSVSAINWLNSCHVPIYCTYLHASRPYYEIDFKTGGAIVMGTESTGLSEVWQKNATANIIIPMRGKVDSMNVSVSAAIVIFEALRQRKNL